MLGSSSAGNAHFATETQLVAGPSGGLNMLRARDPRFDFTVWREPSDPRGFRGSNFGYAAQNNAYLLTKVGELIAGGYRGVVLQFSQNDIPGAASIATALGQVRDAATQFHDAGIGVYLVTLNPRSTSGPAGLAENNYAGFRKIGEYNTGLERLAQEIDAEFIDTRPWLYDYTSNPLGVANPGVSRDGQHMTSLGHWLWSLAAEPVFARTIAPGYPHRRFSARDPGNLYANGTLSGTGGVHSQFKQQCGTLGQSGVLPDKVRFGLASDSTSDSFATTSIIDDPEEGKAIRVAYTLNDADGTSIWRMLFTHTPHSSGSAIPAPGMTGKWIRGYLRLYIERGGEYLQYLASVLSARDSSNRNLFRAVEWNSAIGTTDDPVADASLNGRALWLVTEPFQCPEGTGELYFDVQTQFAGTGSAAIHYSRPAIREVGDPRV